MAGKTNVETPAPTMADVIRNRAYQLWGVRPESPSKSGGGAKKAKAGGKPAGAAAGKAAKKTTPKKTAAKKTTPKRTTTGKTARPPARARTKS